MYFTKVGGCLESFLNDSNPSPSSDNDDDGESAAGGRLAHLLQILVSYSLLWPIDR